MTLSQLFLPQFPHCGGDPAPVPWTAGDRLGDGVTWGQRLLQTRGSCSHRTEPHPGHIFSFQVGSLCRGARGDLTKPWAMDSVGGSPWGRQGWLASLPLQGWWAKVTNGETEAWLVHGVAPRAAGAGSRAGCFRSHGPSGDSAVFWVGCGEAVSQEPKNKRSCWPRLCKSVCTPRYAGVWRLWRQSLGVRGRILAPGPGNAGIRRAGGCPVFRRSLSPSCAACEPPGLP